MRIEKKGFTLIELLATIVILTLIFVIGFVLIYGLLDDSEELMNDATKKLILNAAEQYAMEFRNEEDWKEEIDANGNISFCINMESLINYGYFDNNESEIINYKDKYFVEVNIINGVYNYKLVEIENASANCKYFNKETITDNGSGNIKITEGENDIGDFGYEISKIDNKLYEAFIDISIDFKIQQFVKKIPTYVTLVVDNSGSMNGTRYTNAKKAAVDFSKDILKQENVPDANIALVQYSNNPTLKRNFTNAPLTESSFLATDNMTNTSGGLDLATSLFYKLETEGVNPNFYTILLYDGLPNYYSYVTYNGSRLNPSNITTLEKKDYYFTNFINQNVVGSCSSTCIDYVQYSSNYLKETGSKLIVIGYDMSSVDYRLKTIATQDSSFCKNSSYTDYCYYNSDTANIETLFSNLSSTIIENVKSTNAKAAKVILTSPIIKVNGVDEKAFTIVQNGETKDKIEESIQIEGAEESKVLTVKGTYQLFINENILSSCDSDECKIDIGKLFDVQILLEYGEGEEDKIIPIDEDKLPSFTITITETGKVN